MAQVRMGECPVVEDLRRECANMLNGMLQRARGSMTKTAWKFESTTADGPAP
jgi:hypothetical protein